MNWFFAIWVFDVPIFHPWYTTLTSIPRNGKFVQIITILKAISFWKLPCDFIATKETYSKWYFRSFSWLTCTIWLDVTRWRGSASDGISCCLGLRFKGWNFFGFLFWTTGLKPWEEVVDFDICLDDEDGRFLPLRVRLPLINWAAFLSFAVNVFEDAVWWWFSVSVWSAAAFLFGRRSLKNVYQNTYTMYILDSFILAQFE